MCSLFGLIDFKECLSTHTKNKILNTLARECQVPSADLQASPSRSQDENSYSARYKCRDGSHSHDDTG